MEDNTLLKDLQVSPGMINVLFDDSVYGKMNTTVWVNAFLSTSFPVPEVYTAFAGEIKCKVDDSNRPAPTR